MTAKISDEDFEKADFANAQELAYNVISDSNNSNFSVIALLVADNA